MDGSIAAEIGVGRRDGRQPPFQSADARSVPRRVWRIWAASRDEKPQFAGFRPRSSSCDQRARIRPRPRVLRTAQQQVPDFVGDGAPEQSRHGRGGAVRRSREPETGRPSSTRRRAARDRPSTRRARRCARLCSRGVRSTSLSMRSRPASSGSVHGAPSVLPGTRQSIHSSEIPARWKICAGLRSRGCELVGRHVRVVVGSDRRPWLRARRRLERTPHARPSAIDMKKNRAPSCAHCAAAGRVPQCTRGDATGETLVTR